MGTSVFHSDVEGERTKYEGTLRVGTISPWIRSDLLRCNVGSAATGKALGLGIRATRDSKRAGEVIRAFGIVEHFNLS